MFQRLIAIALLFACIAPISAADAPRGLDIYFIDTEGGAATLIVTPAGQSFLVDCGNPGVRDADRIFKVASEHAKLKQIDYLAITHWHADHYGGVARLAQRIPIRNFLDRGIPESLKEDKKRFPLLIQAFKEASKGKSKTLVPGDSVNLKQVEGGPKLELKCLCAAGKFIEAPKDAKENPLAKNHKPKSEDTSDNAMSLGFLLSYGAFRFLDLGDLTWNNEHKLVHPVDRIGLVDVYQVTHHGLNSSNNPVLVQTVQPRVAIFNNGPRKGAHPEVTATLRRVKGIEAIYQLHRNLGVGAQENTDPALIANPDEKCQGEIIKLSVAPDGKSYTITVGSKGKPRRYECRGK